MSASKDMGEKPILEDQLGLSGEATAVPQKSETAQATENLTESTEVPEESLQPHNKVPWYKNKHTWIKVVFSIIVAIGVILGSLAWYGRSQDTQHIRDAWQVVGQSAERASGEVSRSSYDSFDSAHQALGDMSNQVRDIKAANKASFLGNASLIKSFGEVLDKLKAYTDKARDQSSRIQDITASDLDDLKSTATATKLAIADFQKEQSVTFSSSITEDFFQLNERYDRLIKAHNDAEDTKKAEADAALSKEEQAKQDKADAEEAASRWTQAYIAGSVADMKKYMTAPFAKEYDFSQVTASWRTTNYPKTYRRVSTDQKSEAYEVVETITFITKSDYTPDSSYTTTYVFLITQDSSSKKWLINSQRYQ